MQNDERLFAVYHRIEVPPLREPQLQEVVSRPANLLGARFETAQPPYEHLIERRLANETWDGTSTLPLLIARRAAESSVKGAGALPLLSYLLEDFMFQMELLRRNIGVGWLAEIVANPIMIAVLMIVVRTVQASQVQYLALVWTQARYAVTGILGTLLIIALTDALSFLTGYVGSRAFDQQT